MSTFNRNTLAAALAVSLASLVSAPAMASGKITKTSAITAPEAYAFATEVTGGTSNNPTATVEGAFSYDIVGPDILIGRTAASGDISVTLTVAGAQLVTPGNTVTVTGGMGQGTVNTVSVFANTIQFTISPPAGSGMAPGTLFTIDAGTLQLIKAAGLTPSGGGFTATVLIEDTNTGTDLVTAPATVVLSNSNATKTTIKADAGSPITIDVAAAVQKTEFLIGGTNQRSAELGTVAFALKDVSTSVTPSVPSALGTGATGNESGGRFTFDAAADTADITLTVPDAVAFGSTATGSNPPNAGFWASTAPCATVNTLPGNSAGSLQRFALATGTSDTFEANVPLTATGNTWHICALVNGVNAIGQQTISANAQIDIDDALGRDPAAVSGDLAELRFNGTVVNVATFNPAGNTTQESFLRVSNTGGIDGLVTVEGTDDDGMAGAANVTFTLPAGKSLQFNSNDLEAGNASKFTSGALGDGAGKWRLVVTGEFSGMVVSSLNRNNTVGTLTDMSSTSNKNSLPAVQ